MATLGTLKTVYQAQYLEGRYARQTDEPRDSNPYLIETPLFEAWDLGWIEEDDLRALQSDTREL